MRSLSSLLSWKIELSAHQWLWFYLLLASYRGWFSLLLHSRCSVHAGLIWIYGYGTSIYTSQNGFYSVRWTDIRLAIPLGLINRMFGFADAIKKITRLPVSVCFRIYVAPFINSFQTHIEWLLKCFCMDFIHGFPIVLNVH